MGTLIFIGFIVVAVIAYLYGYCAGGCDKQKELVDKFSLTK